MCIIFSSFNSRKQSTNEKKESAMKTSDYSHVNSHSSTTPKTGGFEGVRDIFKIIIAVILPPLGVFLEVGLSKHFWINLILTLFGYIPGIIHAFWVILAK